MTDEERQPERSPSGSVRVFTAAEIDTAVAALTETDRLNDAQDIVVRSAPSLREVLRDTIAEGGWFDTAHAQALREALILEDVTERQRAIRSLVDQEVQLGMLVGVAVGLELAVELDYGEISRQSKGSTTDPKSAGG